ncbi:hypothetical protein PM082_021953 [Marasmius tenuissimus]|nr:hypothetical protein PM082_021953 [Marasmius tenuissimus]
MYKHLDLKQRKEILAFWNQAALRSLSGPQSPQKNPTSTSSTGHDWIDAAKKAAAEEAAAAAAAADGGGDDGGDGLWLKPYIGCDCLCTPKDKPPEISALLLVRFNLAKHL